MQVLHLGSISTTRLIDLIIKIRELESIQNLKEKMIGLSKIMLWNFEIGSLLIKERLVLFDHGVK